MASLASDEPVIPRPLLVIGVPVAAVLLTGFFVFRGFPYEQVAGLLTARLRATGVEVSFQEIGPHLSLAGPGIEARGVRVVQGDRMLPLEVARLRPAWSLAWLRGTPAVYAELEGPMGGAAGTFTAGDEPGWSGEVREVSLARLPLDAGDFQGTLDATLDIALAAQGPRGPVRFEARDGTLALPGVPMPIPYEKLSGELELGDEGFARISALHLEGPMLTADITGTIGQAVSFAAAPLALDAELQAQPGLVPAIQSVGVRLGRDGKGRVRIQGTVSRPRFN